MPEGLSTGNENNVICLISTTKTLFYYLMIQTSEISDFQRFFFIALPAAGSPVTGPTPDSEL